MANFDFSFLDEIKPEENAQGTNNAQNKQGYDYSFLKETKPEITEEPRGFLGNIAAGFANQASGVGEGAALFGDAYLGSSGSLADDMNAAALATRRDKNYAYTDMIPFTSDYYTNSSGLPYDASGQLGSMTSLIGLNSLAASWLVSKGILPAEALNSLMTKAPTVVAAFLTRFAPKAQGDGPIGKVFGELGKLIAESSGTEVATEMGSAYGEALDEGKSEAQARKEGLVTGAVQAPFMAVGNALQGKILAEGKPGLFNAIKNIAADKSIEGYTEGVQSASHDYAHSKNGSLSDVFNPFGWTDENKTEAATAFVAGLPLSGGTEVVRNIGNRIQRNGEPAKIAEPIDENGNPIRDTQSQSAATSEKEAFINAIGGQESGGDYGATNARTGAAGKYQIMPENWPAWAEEAGLGKDAEMTPENQEIVARFKLGQYYDKYGPEGAATAWYAGEGAINYSEEAKNRKQGNGDEPSINEYVNSVMGRMKQGYNADLLGGRSPYDVIEDYMTNEATGEEYSELQQILDEKDDAKAQEKALDILIAQRKKEQEEANATTADTQQTEAQEDTTTAPVETTATENSSGTDKSTDVVETKVDTPTATTAPATTETPVEKGEENKPVTTAQTTEVPQPKSTPMSGFVKEAPAPSSQIVGIAKQLRSKLDDIYKKGMYNGVQLNEDVMARLGTAIEKNDVPELNNIRKELGMDMRGIKDLDRYVNQYKEDKAVEPTQPVDDSPQFAADESERRTIGRLNKAAGGLLYDFEVAKKRSAGETAKAFRKKLEKAFKEGKISKETKEKLDADFSETLKDTVDNKAGKSVPKGWEVRDGEEVKIANEALQAPAKQIVEKRKKVLLYNLQRQAPQITVDKVLNELKGIVDRQCNNFRGFTSKDRGEIMEALTKEISVCADESAKEHYEKAIKYLSDLSNKRIQDFKDGNLTLEDAQKRIGGLFNSAQDTVDYILSFGANRDVIPASELEGLQKQFEDKLQQAAAEVDKGKDNSSATAAEPKETTEGKEDGKKKTTKPKASAEEKAKERHDKAVVKIKDKHDEMIAKLQEKMDDEDKEKVYRAVFMNAKYRPKDTFKKFVDGYVGKGYITRDEGDKAVSDFNAAFDKEVGPLKDSKANNAKAGYKDRIKRYRENNGGFDLKGGIKESINDLISDGIFTQEEADALWKELEPQIDAAIAEVEGKKKTAETEEKKEPAPKEEGSEETTEPKPQEEEGSEESEGGTTDETTDINSEEGNQPTESGETENNDSSETETSEEVEEAEDASTTETGEEPITVDNAADDLLNGLSGDEKSIWEEILFGKKEGEEETAESKGSDKETAEDEDLSAAVQAQQEESDLNKRADAEQTLEDKFDNYVGELRKQKGAAKSISSLLKNKDEVLNLARAEGLELYVDNSVDSKPYYYRTAATGEKYEKVRTVSVIKAVSAITGIEIKGLSKEEAASIKKARAPKQQTLRDVVPVDAYEEDYKTELYNQYSDDDIDDICNFLESPSDIDPHKNWREAIEEAFFEDAKLNDDINQDKITKALADNVDGIDISREYYDWLSAKYGSKVIKTTRKSTKRNADELAMDLTDTLDDILSKEKANLETTQIAREKILAYIQENNIDLDPNNVEQVAQLLDTVMPKKTKATKVQPKTKSTETKIEPTETKTEPTETKSSSNKEGNGDPLEALKKTNPEAYAKAMAARAKIDEAKLAGMKLSLKDKQDVKENDFADYDKGLISQVLDFAKIMFDNCGGSRALWNDLVLGSFQQAKENLNKLSEFIWRFVSNFPQDVEFVAKNAELALQAAFSSLKMSVKEQKAMLERGTKAGFGPYFEAAFNAVKFYPRRNANNVVQSNKETVEGGTSNDDVGMAGLSSGSGNRGGNGNQLENHNGNEISQGEEPSSNRNQAQNRGTNRQPESSDAISGTGSNLSGEQSNNQSGSQVSGNQRRGSGNSSNIGGSSSVQTNGSRRNGAGNASAQKGVVNQQRNEVSRNVSPQPHAVQVNNFTGKIKEGDPDDVRETLSSVLYDAQCDDVVKTEKRLYVDGGKGMLIANGTGTGKTRSGLGVIMRQWMQGKRNILVVVHNGAIGEDWVKEGIRCGFDEDNFVKVATKESFDGHINVITYQSLWQNPSLVERNWDLIVCDESHKLAAKENGTPNDPGDPVSGLWAVSGHENGQDRFIWLKTKPWQQMLNKAMPRLKELNKMIEGLRAGGKFTIPYKYDAKKGELKVLSDHIELTQDQEIKLHNAEAASKYAATEFLVKFLNNYYTKMATKATKEISKATPGATKEYEQRVKANKNNKVIFLSATPFAYPECVYAAEGYLFDYADFGGSFETMMQKVFKFKDQGGGKVVPETEGFGVSKFRVPHDKEEVGFHNWLLKSGAMSKRKLEIEGIDFNRRFIKVKSGIMDKIDDVFLQMKHSEDESVRNICEILEKRFSYTASRRIEESCKAEGVVPLIKKSIAEGKHVVLLHDYRKEDPVIHPFKLSKQEIKELTPELQNNYNSFINSDLGKKAQALDIGALKSVPEVMREAFGEDTLMINGGQKEAEIQLAKDVFNREGNYQEQMAKHQGDPYYGNLIVCTTDKAKEGTSLHDKVGNAQRISYNLGLPLKPTDDAQTSGRTRRFGAKSNAQLRYIITGSDRETEMFINRISARSRAAENLAMGDDARVINNILTAGYLRGEASEEINESNIDKFADNETTGGVQEDNMSAAESRGTVIKLLTERHKRQKKLHPQLVELADKLEAQEDAAKRAEVLTPKNKKKFVESLVKKFDLRGKPTEIGEGVYLVELANGNELVIDGNSASMEVFDHMTAEEKAKYIKAAEMNPDGNLGAAGYYVPSEARKELGGRKVPVIYLTEAAEKHTLDHEIMHFIINTVLSKAERDKLFAYFAYQIKKDIGLDAYNKLSREERELMIEERAAKGYEAYMADRIAPKPFLKQCWNKVEGWLAELLNNFGVTTPLGIYSATASGRIYSRNANIKSNAYARKDLPASRLRRLNDHLDNIKSQLMKVKGLTEEQADTEIELLNAHANAYYPDDPAAFFDTHPISFDDGSDNGSKEKSLNQAVGEKSKTKDKEKLNLAKKMARRREDPLDIWAATGWYRGADGKWRYEIPDDLTQIDESLFDKQETTLEKLYGNSALFEAHPKLKKVKVEFYEGDENDYGGFNPKTQTIYLNRSATIGNQRITANNALFSELIREIRYWLREKEGFRASRSEAYRSLRDLLAVAHGRNARKGYFEKEPVLTVTDFLNGYYSQLSKEKYEKALSQIPEDFFLKIKEPLSAYVDGDFSNKKEILDKLVIMMLKEGAAPPPRNNLAIKTTLIHELQHVIQQIEGFAPGGSPETARSVIEQQITRLQNKVDEYLKNPTLKRWNGISFFDDRQGWREMQQEKADNKVLAKQFADMIAVQDRIRELQYRLDRSSDFELYEDLAGEQEANLAIEKLTPPEDKEEERSRIYNMLYHDNEIVLDADIDADVASRKTLKQYAGARAKTADVVAMDTAKKMEADGIDSKTIYKTTGWFKGGDGKWRYEIPDTFFEDFDRNMLKKSEALEGIPLYKIYKNKALYEAYPQLKNLPVKVKDLVSGTAGYYDPTEKVLVISSRQVDKNDSFLIKVFAHELQHAIQCIENFAAGGSPQTAKTYIMDALESSLADDIENAIGVKLDALDDVDDAIEYRAAYNDAAPASVEQKKAERQYIATTKRLGLKEKDMEWFGERIDEIVSVDKMSPLDVYYGLHGEVEARATGGIAETEYLASIRNAKPFETILKPMKKGEPSIIYNAFSKLASKLEKSADLMFETGEIFEKEDLVKTIPLLRALKHFPKYRRVIDELYDLYEHGGADALGFSLNEEQRELIRLDSINDINHSLFVIFDERNNSSLSFVPPYASPYKIEGVTKGEISWDRAGAAEVHLFKGKADFSTVVHETGHYFLEALWEDIKNGVATKQQEADFDALMEYCGMTRADWEAATFAQRAPAHERIGEGFETYLMEGKAPTAKLRRAFERIKKWMLDIYKVVKGEYINGNRNENAVQLTDDVREVFDRMLHNDGPLKDSPEIIVRKTLDSVMQEEPKADGTIRFSLKQMTDPEGKVMPDAPEANQEAVGKKAFDSIKKVADVAPGFKTLVDKITKNTSKPDIKVEYADNKAIERGLYASIKEAMQSPSRIETKTFKPFFDIFDKAFQVQEHTRNWAYKNMNKSMESIKTQDDRDALTNILLEGEVTQQEYTAAELKEQGVNQNVIDAYKGIRALYNSLWKKVNDAHRGVKTYHVSKMRGKDVKALLATFGVENVVIKNPNGTGFIKADPKEIISELSYQVTYDRPKVFKTTKKRMTMEELAELKQDENVRIGKIDRIDYAGGDLKRYEVSYQRKIGDIGKIEGYLPHVFHHWVVYIKTEDGKFVPIEDDASAKTCKDAVERARQFLNDNPNIDPESLVVRPMVFNENSLGNLGKSIGSDASNIAMTDMQAIKATKKIEEMSELSYREASKIVSAVGKRTSKNRFFGNLLHRKGVKGYESDPFLATDRYIATASRYIAMQPAKNAAIPLYERTFGQVYDQDINMSKKSMAWLVKDYIGWCNGNPGVCEILTNNLLNSSKFYRDHVSATYGDRAVIAAANSANSWVSKAKLGVCNVSTAIVNMFQLSNTFGLVGPEAMAKGLKALANLSMTDKKVLLATGVKDDLDMSTASGFTKLRVPTSLASIKNGGFSGVIDAINVLAGKGLVLFQKSEHMVRKITVLSAYHKAIDEGKTHEQAIAYAKTINRKANFDYSAADTPLAMRYTRGTGIHEMFMLFKKYPVKELELMIEMLGSESSAAQKARFWLAYYMLAGLLGMPFGDTLDDLLESLLGFKPSTYVKAAAFKMFGDNIGTRMALYGAGALVGVDTSKRLGMQDALPSAENNILLLTGATGSTISQAAQAAWRADLPGVAKSISPELGALADAWRGYKVNSKGQIIHKYTGYERALRAAGFRPITESIDSDMQSFAYQDRQLRNDKKQAIAQKLAAKKIDGEEITKDDIAEAREYGVSAKSINEAARKMKMSQKERNQENLTKEQRRDFKDNSVLWSNDND